MTAAGSLRLRLFLAGTVAVVLALALSGFGLGLLFERHVERRAIAELSVHLEQVIAGLDRGADNVLTVVRPPADPRFRRPLSGLYWQIVVDGKVLRSRSLWDGALNLPADALPGGQIHEHQIAGPDGQALLALERSVTLAPRLGALPARGAVAIDRSEIAAATRAFVADLAPFLLIIAVLLLAAGWIQVTVGLRPLAAIRDRVAAIRAGTLNRLGSGFPAEVRPLATEVDALLEARQAQIDQARARAADLAHGLKTPLQVLSGDVQRLRDRGETAIADEVAGVARSMHRHVERELARARLGAEGKDAQADLRTVARRVVSVARRTPDGQRLDWSVETPPGLAARIDVDDLTEAVGNLAENAARFAQARIVISAASQQDTITLTVRDDGPGIPADKIAAVLDRGVRLDRTSGGTGLGLAIVDEIARAWNGRLTLSSEQPGFAATLTLPAAPG